MAKASDNEFPSLLVKEGAAPASPAAGDQRLFIDSADHILKVKNSGGTVSTVAGTAASVATDTIWAAAGDLPVGTGVHTAGVLTKGAAGTVLTAGASTLAWGYPALTTVDAAQGADITIPGSAAFADLCSIALTAGTWDIWGWIQAQGTATGGYGTLYGAITDGSNTQLTNENVYNNINGANAVTPLFVGAYVVATTATVKLRGAADNANGKFTGTTSGGTGAGSKIHALRIA